MRKALCLALFAAATSACGDAGDSPGDEQDAAPDPNKTDASPNATDAPLPQVSDGALDLSVIPADALLDVPAVVDAPVTTVDAPLTIDTFVAVDAPRAATDAETRTLRSPDGRTWTVIMVDACYTGPVPSSQCPRTYAEARDKLAASMDAGLPFNFGTGIGQCIEGSYVYAPLWGLESVFCFYDASTQKVLASRSSSDVTHECGIDGTASNSWSQGDVPRCTTITWEIRKMPYE